MRADRKSQIPENGRRAPEHRSDGGASGPKATDDLEPREAATPDALKLLLKQCRELGGYFSYYMTVKADSTKLSLRNIGLWIVLGTLAFTVVAGLIITASWLLLNGIAEGLGVLFGDRLWVGNLITGFLTMASLALVMLYQLASRRTTSRERTFDKHEDRQSRQHEQFGRDVSDQAAANASEKN